MSEAAGRRAFIGRGVELARLRELLVRAGRGEGQAVVVGGEAGIGKSRLVGRFTEEAERDGAAVLSGACLEAGAGGVPYAPFVEALRALVRSTEPGRLAALLGPGRADLARLLPELSTRPAEGNADEEEPDPAAQARLFERILGVAERLAARAPVVLVIDDIQWADASSRDLLGFLIRCFRATRVLTILTARTEDLAGHSAVLEFLAELERDENVARLEVRPFERDEVVAQVEALLGGPAEPELVDRIFDRSDGNPFFAEQLMAADSEAGGLAVGGDAGDTSVPPRLQDVLLARITGLSGRAQEVLRAAAVAGRRIDDTLLADALAMPPRDLHESLREVLSRGILVAQTGAGGETVYAFRHALLQEVVYGGLFAGERVRLHEAFARALSGRSERGEAGVEPAELARHWDLARNPQRALPATVAAAAAAERVYAYSIARRHYERAIELWPRVGTAEKLVPGGRVGLCRAAAEAAMLGGEGQRAIQLARLAIEAVDPAADPAEAALLHERLRWFLWEAGERRAAAEAVATAASLVPTEPPSSARAGILAHLAGVELFGGDYFTSRDHAADAIRVARSVGAANEEALALGILGWDEAVLGDVDRGVAVFEEGMRIAEAAQSVEGIALGATNLASLFDRVGRSEAALGAALKGFETTRRLGVERTYGALLLGYAAKAQIALGRWDEADETTARALRRGAQGRSALWLLINRARLLTGRGRFDEAADALGRARAIEDRLGGTEFGSPLLEAVAELGAWQRRPEDVRPAVEEGLRRALDSGPPDPALAWLAAYALRVEADEAERARARRDPDGEADARGRGGELMDRIERAIPTLRRFGVWLVGEGLIGESLAAEGLATEGLAADLPAATPDGARATALARLCFAESRRLDGTDSAVAWAGVAEGWRAADRPFPTAYALWRQAVAILATRGPRSQAEAALREAARIAESLGAAPLASEVKLLARQARIGLGPAVTEIDAPSPSTADGAVAYGFTAREAEVLRLVAGGWTNRQIADALFISRKTASVHVSNILGKLGVDSRTEAAAVAHRLGLGRDAPPPPDSTFSAPLAQGETPA